MGEEAPARDLEAEIVDRQRLREALRDALETDIAIRRVLQGGTGLLHRVHS
jgi:hypothetical protein